ncbi:MAG: IS1595 family transposase [Actinomycetota bacterium]|nr:IS1595 family transposase [Actinomycetota bacterium]
METLNISTLAKRFSDEGAAYELLEEMRWPNGPECPHCGTVGRAYFLKPKNGQRLTSTGKVSHRRLWKCASCRKKFSVLVGTIFESSHVPLSKWLMALYMMASNKNGVAAFEVHRTLGVTNETAWFMLHRIREAMKRGELADTMRGTIVADETFIGGDPKNRHASSITPRPIKAGEPRIKTDKVSVLSLINRSTGEVRSQVIPDVTGPTLAKAMAEHVNMANSHLQSDGWMGYRQFAGQFISHDWVDHGNGEYVRGDVTTNEAENYFSQLKRSLDGTFHHVSREHLGRYLTEFDFRYSTRKMTDSDRMRRVVGQAGGRRLTYQTIT